MESTPKPPCELKSITLVSARCACGWKYRREESLKGITDEELATDTHGIFEAHIHEEKNK